MYGTKYLKLNRFQLGQLVLKYNGHNKIKPSRFKIKWVGPYKIHEVGENKAINLWTLDGKEVTNAMNGSKLKVYHERNNAPPWTSN